MKKFKDQLKGISKSIASLSKQVEKIINQIDKLQPKKAAPFPKKAAPKKKVAVKKTTAKQLTVIDTVFNAIKRTRKGVTVAQLKEKTDLNSRQLSNALYKLSKRGKIEPKSRGLYVTK